MLQGVETEMIIIQYRKPKYHKNIFPWEQIEDTAGGAIAFMKKLGKEYDFRLFGEMSQNELKILARQEKL